MDDTLTEPMVAAIVGRIAAFGDDVQTFEGIFGGPESVRLLPYLVGQSGLHGDALLNQKEIERATGLNKHEQVRAREQLKKKRFLEETRVGRWRILYVPQTDRIAAACQQAGIGPRAGQIWPALTTEQVIAGQIPPAEQTFAKELGIDLVAAVYHWGPAKILRAFHKMRTEFDEITSPVALLSTICERGAIPMGRSRGTLVPQSTPRPMSPHPARSRTLRTANRYPTRTTLMRRIMRQGRNRRRPTCWPFSRHIG